MKLDRSLLVMFGTLAVSSAFASPELAQKKNCMTCHAVDTRLIGPGFKEVAVKYSGDKEAADKLVKKILKGGTGVWGNAVMPPNPQLSEADAKQLLEWVLSLK